MSAPVLTLDGASRVFAPDSPSETRALDEVSLTVHAGEIVVVMGRSGSGKSTLLNVSGLLDRPTSGVVRVAGVDVAGLGETEQRRLRASHIGFVFQRHHLFEHRPVAASVALPLLHRRERMTGAQIEGRIEESLEQVDMMWAGARTAASLSGGERQRVAIARAMVCSPSLLLCDEPTGQLDSENAERVIEAICRTADRGTAVVVVTHDPGPARFAHRILTMSDGRLSD